MKRDYLSAFYDIKKGLESAHKKQKIFTHPTTKSKLIRQHQYQFIESHNSNIDIQISHEITKLVCILKDVIIDNNIPKLQELVSHGILEEIKNSCNSDNACYHHHNNNNHDMSDIKNVITEIIGCILQYVREECLLIIAPFIQCKYFDINKFDRPILTDPYKIILFLHSKNLINLKASHCKLFHKCCEYGHYQTVKYCLDNNVPVHSCQNRAIRDAARHGHLEIVKLLHSNGGNIHQYHDECLRKAARHGHLNIIIYCIQHNANIHAKNSQSLILTVQNGHLQCAEYLIKLGILSKHENLLITQQAIKYKQYNCLSLLLRYGYVLYDQQLRSLALSELYGHELHDNNDNNHNQMEDDMNDMMINYETESSASPPLSPTLSPGFSPSISPRYTSSVSPIIGHFDDFYFEDEQDTNQRLLDAISEGLALRETMLITVLSEFIIDEIAFIICSYEKLALTHEDDMALHEMKTKPKSHYKRNFSA